MKNYKRKWKNRETLQTEPDQHHDIQRIPEKVKPPKGPKPKVGFFQRFSIMGKRNKDGNKTHRKSLSKNTELHDKEAHENVDPLNNTVSMNELEKLEGPFGGAVETE
mmetsp:Transcript_8683/g.8205  ORF Transcript_8683/g.8205 Transcript_8683/m.8205 type:complete len:107 (-) Transcript_8683:77-397(-)